MRQDQFESLQKRGEELIDLFLEESNPADWPGEGLRTGAMDAQTRGDRYWCKKNAVATLACAQRIANLIDVVRKKTSEGNDDPEAVSPTDDSLDGEVAAAEREAQAVLDRAQKAAKKETFDRKVHGSKK